MVETVRGWLSRVGFAECAEASEAAQIDVEVLAELGWADLHLGRRVNTAHAS